MKKWIHDKVDWLIVFVLLKLCMFFNRAHLSCLRVLKYTLNRLVKESHDEMYENMKRIIQNGLHKN